MLKLISVEMTDMWWDVVLMAVFDALVDMKPNDLESFEAWRMLNKAKKRIQKALDEQSIQ